MNSKRNPSFASFACCTRQKLWISLLWQVSEGWRNTFSQVFVHPSIGNIHSYCFVWILGLIVRELWNHGPWSRSCRMRFLHLNSFPGATCLPVAKLWLAATHGHTHRQRKETGHLLTRGDRLQSFCQKRTTSASPVNTLCVTLFKMFQSCLQLLIFNKVP